MDQGNRSDCEVHLCDDDADFHSPSPSTPVQAPIHRSYHWECPKHSKTIGRKSVFTKTDLLLACEFPPRVKCWLHNDRDTPLWYSSQNFIQMDFLASKNLIIGGKIIPFLHRQRQKEHLGPVCINGNQTCSGREKSHKDKQRLECQADPRSWGGMGQNYRGRRDSQAQPVELSCGLQNHCPDKDCVDSNLWEWKRPTSSASATRLTG